MTRTSSSDAKRKKRKRTGTGAILEDKAAEMMKLAGIPRPRRQYRFHSTRAWLADFAWPRHRLIVEIQGGIWPRKIKLPSGKVIVAPGRHGRPLGIEKDYVRLAEAQLEGWVVFFVSTNLIRSGEFLTWIKRFLERSSEKKRLRERWHRRACLRNTSASTVRSFA